MNIDPKEAVNRLREIQIEIDELLDEARDIIKDSCCASWERAKCYWFAHIKCAIHRETEFRGGSMVTMDETIEEIEETDTTNNEEGV